MKPTVNPNALFEVLSSVTGSITSEQLSSLAISVPSLVVGVKMGVSNRFVVDARNAQRVIAARIAQDSNDYVREVFIPADTFRELRKLIGVQVLPPPPPRKVEMPDNDERRKARMERTIFDN